ncbi:MAG TPA: ribosome rescue protein RqcH [Conexivisphaerales archaeon]|nr:ribosome rescue protein RqcH [Conexivisphaerales archaeon]
MSGFEFGALAGKLDSNLGGYYVNNIYLTGSSTVMIKLHMSDRPELSLLVSPRIGAWITSAELPRAPAGRFISELRARLDRAKYASTRASEGERILMTEFTHPDGRLVLVGEFFGAGNVILLDASDRVLACMNDLDVSDRVVRPGVKYVPPKARSMPPSAADAEALSKILPRDEAVERLLGRNVSLPRRIVEETLERAGIAKGRSGSSLQPGEVASIADSLAGILAESRSGGPSYVYVRDGEPVDISSVRLRARGSSEERVYPSILEAMDENFTPLVLRGLAAESVKPEQADLRRLESSITSKKEEVETLKLKASGLRAVASSLMSGAADFEGAARELEGISAYRYDRGARAWTSGGKRLYVDSTYALASRIFADAKEADSAAAKLSDALERLERRRSELSSSIDREAGTKVMAHRRRERRWFEKFRWFHTSEGFFAIGGRDAGSNSILVRKHLEPSDLVFHTEIPGSAFFVLKGGQGAGADSIREVAEATVSYSRAWREGLTSADAYYVRPEQVLKGAPSGQYLPKGSFVIEGERSYLKGIELRVSLGVGPLDGALALYSGPSSALIKRCQLVVELVPGHLPTHEAAKKMKRELASHLEGDARAFVDGLPVDDFVRALPTGKLRLLRVLRGPAAPEA